MLEHASVFHHPDIVNFTQLTLDDHHEQLLVGSRDSLFRLSLDDLSLKEFVEDDATDPQGCLDKGLAEVCYYCQSYCPLSILYFTHNKYSETSENRYPGESEFLEY